MAVFASLANAARADGYATTGPTGGSATSTPGPGPQNYSTNNGVYGGGTNPATSASCNGAITTTYTWKGNSTPPQDVIVMETATATANATFFGSQSGNPTASGTDGLGDMIPTTPSYSAPGVIPTTESVGGIVSRTRYTEKSGGATVTLTCTPTASASDPPQSLASASVGYTPSISPVTINLSSAPQDGSGNYDILVGQQCTAKLGGIPPGCTVLSSSYSWSVSGTTFQYWSDTTLIPANSQASSYMGGPGPLNNSSATWYWNDKGPSSTAETVSCTATVMPPTGQGSPFTVKASQTVNVYVPAMVASGTPGTMQVNTSAPNEQGAVCLYAGHVAGANGGGMSFSLLITTPQTPIAFGTGKLQLVQLWTPKLMYTTTDSPPVTHTDNQPEGLDTSYPNYQGPEGAAPAMPSDSPSLPLNDSMSFAQMTSSFNDYLMYQPPGSTAWVPLGTFGWNTNGSATKPFGGWATYGSGSVGQVKLTNGSNFTPSNTFPMWTSINTPTIF